RDRDSVFPDGLGGGRHRGNRAAFAHLGLGWRAGCAVCVPFVSRVAHLAGNGSAVTPRSRISSNKTSPDEALAALAPVRDTRAVPALFLIVVIDLVGFGLVIPLLPFYAVRFAASPQHVTTLVAVYSLAQLLTAPLWGKLSDRIGRRPVLLASLAASALAYLWLGA